MYSPKETAQFRSSSKRPLPASPDARPLEQPARNAGDDWAEESNRQTAALAAGAHAETGVFAEFRRKLAMGEALSRAVAKLAEALRFSGRITVSFHQGRITKTVLEELHVRNTKATPLSP